ncbi:MAG TPA: hypothetical protein ENH01_07620 [Nitrospirae bacterium]|nr:hypothetical protein [Nitrospirota bacterium]
MAYYKDLAGKFRQISQDPDKFLDVFAEFDFVRDEGECNFFCPECRNMLKCGDYNEFEDDWEWFYI